MMMISQKVALRLFARRGRKFPPPPSEINSDGSTPTSGRRLFALGRLTDFLRVRHLYEINILVAGRRFITVYNDRLFLSPKYGI